MARRSKELRGVVDDDIDNRRALARQREVALRTPAA